MAQTADGYLWIGTEDGLARFDGVKFVIFRKHNTPQLQSNQISALLVDRAGDLWIGTHGGGLAKLSRGKFFAYTTATGLSSDTIVTLYQDQKGRLWVGTDGGGISVLDHGKFFQFSTRDGLASDTVFSIAGDRLGRI
jgi:ligand-binding sensor domain-containing protein